MKKPDTAEVMSLARNALDSPHFWGGLYWGLGIGGTVGFLLGVVA